MSDDELMDIYMKGWADELDGVMNKPSDPLALRAYNIGRYDAVVGDDMPSYEYKRTRKVILKEIRV